VAKYLVTVDYASKQYYCTKCGAVEMFASESRIITLKQLRRFEELHTALHRKPDEVKPQIKMEL
jgi:hypothetical protein